MTLFAQRDGNTLGIDIFRTDFPYSRHVPRRRSVRGCPNIQVRTSPNTSSVYGLREACVEGKSLRTSGPGPLYHCIPCVQACFSCLEPCQTYNPCGFCTCEGRLSCRLPRAFQRCAGLGRAIDGSPSRGPMSVVKCRFFPGDL